MSTNVPTNTWRIPTRNSELGGTSSLDLTTQSGVTITTQSGLTIVTQVGTETDEPATVWATVDVTPATDWRPDVQGEITEEGVYAIADSSSTFLVDTDGDSIVDTGVIYTTTPDTDWTEDDSI